MKALDDDYEDCGLYQIYGRHVIFGEDSLLYIGMTTWAFERRFFSGSKSHIQWLEEEEGLSVYVGRIVEEDYDHEADWKHVLKDAEALTIYWHSPPYDQSKVNIWKLLILAITAVYAKNTEGKI